MNQIWVGRGGQRFGPFSPARILVAERQQKLVAGDSLWWSGLDRPLPLEPGLEAIKSLLRKPPAPTRATGVVVSASEDIPMLTQVEAPAARSLRELAYADFGPRYAAAAVDSAILCTAAGVIVALATPVLGLRHALQAGVALVIVAGCLYFAMLESGPHHATVGKRWFDLQVAHAYTREPIGILRASLRFAARGLSALILMLGFAMQVFTVHRQAWHDILTRTVVVSAAPPIRRRLLVAYALSAWVVVILLMAYAAFRSSAAKPAPAIQVPAAQGNVRPAPRITAPAPRKSPSPAEPRRPVIPELDRAK
jgi:uncharacterized RDD family membrane protein YckC